jgi:phenylalanyl-tRNA synthetase beta subunit
MLDDQLLGRIGEYSPTVAKGLKLPAFTAGFEINIAALLSRPAGSQYVQLPRFPKVTQDITLKVASEVSYQQLYDVVSIALQAAQPDYVWSSLQSLDMYQGDDVEHKHISLRLQIASYQRTLTDAEITKVLDLVATAAHEQLNTERI